jgi:hypothetical protein
VEFSARILGKIMDKFSIEKQDFRNGVTIDWLRLSVHYRMWGEVAAWLGIPGDGWEEKNRFNKQYGIYLMDGVAVYADHCPTLLEDGSFGLYPDTPVTGEQRFIVDWSGSGLGHWHKEKGATPLDLLRRAREIAQSENTIRVQRLDIAFDDFDGLLDMEKVERYLSKTNLVVTRWETFERKSKDQIRKQRDEDPEPAGETIYIGNRLSNSFARIYDKLKEVTSKLNREARRAVAKEQALPKHWVRFELELKRQHAQAVADGMLGADDATSYVMGVLRGKIDFKATSGDKRIRRRGPVRWWREFTQRCGAVPIRVPRPALTIDRIRSWLTKAVAQSLGVIYSVDGGDAGGEQTLVALARIGLKRLDKKKEGLLRQHEAAMAHGL